jgi:hypothetical protein
MELFKAELCPAVLFDGLFSRPPCRCGGSSSFVLRSWELLHLPAKWTVFYGQ